MVNRRYEKPERHKVSVIRRRQLLVVHALLQPLQIMAQGLQGGGDDRVNALEQLMGGPGTGNRKGILAQPVIEMAKVGQVGLHSLAAA